MITSDSQLERIFGASHVRVDLDRYARNVRLLREIAGADRELMAVVKANAYGHGAVACTEVALEAGATYLAVARVSEALQLRRAGISAPILVLGGPNLSAIDLAMENDLTLTIGSQAAVDDLLRAVENAAGIARVHLKVDSGLHRYGALPDLAMALARELHRHSQVDLEGIYAHFSSADESDPAPTEAQAAVVYHLIDSLDADGITFKYIHLPNSAATISGRTGRSNLVRAGIATYGLAPSAEVGPPPGIEPVMSVYSCVTRAFRIPAGGGVSYGLTYQSELGEAAATVPIGYADGLPRSLSNRGWFVIGGQRCPIRGRVCMDQTVVGLGVDGWEGELVQVVGDPASGAMTLDQIAEIDGTINYEIATRMSVRMPRVYYRSEEPVSWEDPVLGERGNV